MAADYRIANEDDEAKVLMRAIVAEQPETFWHLKHARIGVVYVTPPQKRHGREILGSAQKVGGYLQLYTGLDFIVTINEEFWKEAEMQQRRQLIDHELHHCWFKIDKDGQPATTHDGEDVKIVFALREHDFLEFYDVALRYGDHCPGYKKMVETVKQQEFNFMNDLGAKACAAADKFYSSLEKSQETIEFSDSNVSEDEEEAEAAAMAADAEGR